MATHNLVCSAEALSGNHPTQIPSFIIDCLYPAFLANDLQGGLRQNEKCSKVSLITMLHHRILKALKQVRKSKGKHYPHLQCFVSLILSVVSCCYQAQFGSKLFQFKGGKNKHVPCFNEGGQVLPYSVVLPFGCMIKFAV